MPTARLGHAQQVAGWPALVGVAGRLRAQAGHAIQGVVGGEFGSEGKGHIASHLATEYDYLLRVGGPNAGHKVYEEPEPYTHHQLPSGTRRCEAGLIIGPGAVLSVPKLLKEIAECGVTNDRLSIDPGVMLIEDADIKFEEKTLKGEIGSTAQGVGSATSRKFLRTAAKPKVRLAKDSPELKPYLRETLSVLEDAFSLGKRVFVEGTQGTGLSLHHGYYPYVTSRDTSGSGCLAEAEIAPTRVRRTVMVVRSYPIRVQSPKDSTSGPMGIDLSCAENLQTFRYTREQTPNQRTNLNNEAEETGTKHCAASRPSIPCESPRLRSCSTWFTPASVRVHGTGRSVMSKARFP